MFVNVTFIEGGLYCWHKRMLEFLELAYSGFYLSEQASVGPTFPHWPGLSGAHLKTSELKQETRESTQHTISSDDY